MGPNFNSVIRRISLTLSSLRTGIALVILLGIAASAGTFILQRPLTDPETITKAYSLTTLRWLDAIGLTDVFHTRWFATLLGLAGLSMVLASLDRFPQAWRFIARPYRHADPAFLGTLKLQKQIPIESEGQGIKAAERAFHAFGLKPQRVDAGQATSLFAERHRYARLAAYVVHASLLLVFAGGMADAVWGYRGFIALRLNQQTNLIEMQSGAPKALPFAIRCDGAGQENYADGSPRRWWSNLAVVEGGQVVARKEISVNEPLVYRGLRIFQSSYGSTGEPSAIHLAATLKSGSADAKNIILQPNVPVQLDASTTVRMVNFVPDFIIEGNQIESRSAQPNNPGIQLAVDSKTSGEAVVWLFPRFPNFSHADRSPYTFKFRGLQMGYYTGLEVAREPGQWAVWGGFGLAALGLALAFYFVHLRVWAVPATDANGRPVLWVGASASKNREEVEGRFLKLTEEIEKNLANEPALLDEAAEILLVRT
ncbi:MAG TPA: cytochrome c biogenesis protein ResB [Terriglobia bacterium]|nr:cytochrome c biogenesis protein ResB [Terriglobia bacterium]